MLEYQTRKNQKYLENAIKYNRSLLQEKEDFKLEIIFDGEKSFYNLSFRDNGIGIEEQHLKLIFNKFYRVPTGNLHDVKGFGLGLYYVKNICELHGWKIDVESVLGEGTSITFGIPLKHK